MGSFFPFRVDDVGRQNAAMMERAMSLFSPFYQPEGVEPPHANAQSAASQAIEEELSALRAEVERLKRELSSRK
jgi:polyhydroxyalkanoate synthesis regulator protein